MNLIKLSWKYLTYRPLSTSLNIVLLALGLAIMTVLILIQDQFEKKVTTDAKGIDLVVGAKGSPLQLILSSVYHIDFPTGNIPMEEAQKLAKNRLVKGVIPLALGDNFKGFRIVGTTYDYLKVYELVPATGSLWELPFDVVLGSEVATQTALKVGDSFAGSHGISVGSHDHDQHDYKVVGILVQSGTVLDRLVLTSIESVWFTHDESEPELGADSLGNVLPSEPIDHEKFHQKVTVSGFPESDQPREITSLLVQYRSPMAAIQLPRMINSRTLMQAASPSFEMARLFELLGVGVSLLQGLAVVLLVISGIGIFIALYNSLKERKYDLAILRAIGASRFQLLFLVFLEGIMLTLIGAVFGILLGHVFLNILIAQNDSGIVAAFEPWIFLRAELWLVLYALAVGLVASLIPAFSAYKTDIATQLTQK
jgi:putative ABC transport system permease protein